MRFRGSAGEEGRGLKFIQPLPYLPSGWSGGLQGLLQRDKNAAFAAVSALAAV
jgi:hypothetical protein